MKRYLKILILTLITAIVFAFAGCSSKVYVTNIEYTGTDGSNDLYTVYYSDGTTSQMTVRGGSDGKDLSIDEVYEKYVEEYGEISYADFLEKYLSSSADTSNTVAECLLSSVKIYSEFVETTTLSIRPGQSYSVSSIATYTGSAVIWSIDGNEDGYTYMVTNYHVVYDSKADESKNGGAKTARKINGYLYGSESKPVDSGEKDENGYTVYDYGSYAVECEYVGGSVTADIAVIRAKTSDLKTINPEIRAVTLSEKYYVGQTALAIGNPEDAGISVTQGIISVDNEYINLNIDGTTRSYRSIRIDTALYSGNSGGGLFNTKGELIGITNAGDSTDQNINYAVPIQIVRGTVENILYFYNDGDQSTAGANKITIGITVLSQNSRYVYDKTSGYGDIFEDVTIEQVVEQSIAQTMGLKEGDIIKSLVINGNEYSVCRSFDISDAILTMRPDNSLSIRYVRDGEQKTTSSYTLKTSDFTRI